MPEGGIDEAVRSTFVLALGQRPQLDRLGTAGQGIRDLPQSQQPSRTHEQESAGSRVAIHLVLDGQQ